MRSILEKKIIMGIFSMKCQIYFTSGVNLEIERS